MHEVLDSPQRHGLFTIACTSCSHPYPAIRVSGPWRGLLLVDSGRGWELVKLERTTKRVYCNDFRCLQCRQGGE